MGRGVQCSPRWAMLNGPEGVLRAESTFIYHTSTHSTSYVASRTDVKLTTGQAHGTRAHRLLGVPVHLLAPGRAACGRRLTARQHGNI
ncbi:hypothetical protein E2C01_004457 [Portunus trituberculatus]|uniref:Uncharacterized protein n=1 Tax=Portunus trituberculatus TaxID=210409 RepID=A0A5B7CWF4_PORTR|nr:hypothetical protein [Portunus trituberculatus]